MNKILDYGGYYMSVKEQKEQNDSSQFLFSSLVFIQFQFCFCGDKQVVN